MPAAVSSPTKTQQSVRKDTLVEYLDELGGDPKAIFFRIKFPCRKLWVEWFQADHLVLPTPVGRWFFVL